MSIRIRGVELKRGDEVLMLGQHGPRYMKFCGRFHGMVELQFLRDSQRMVVNERYIRLPGESARDISIEAVEEIWERFHSKKERHNETKAAERRIGN